MKKTLSIIMAVALLMQMLALCGTVSALEAPAISVSSASGTAGSSVTVTVSIQNNPGFSGLEMYVKFDNSVLEFQSAEGKVEASETTGAMPMVPGDESSITTANTEGRVHCIYIALDNITGDTALFDITFKIKDNAPVGDSALTLEIADLYFYEGVEMKDLTATATNGKVTVTDNIDVNCIGDINYTVDGNVVTVTHTVACKVGYLDGTAYKAITAVANGDGTYSFTAPAGVTEVLLVVKGDVNGNGVIDNPDVTQAKATYLKRRTLSAQAAFAADVTGDGALANPDVTQIKAVYLQRKSLTW